MLILSLGMTAQAQHVCTDPNCTSCATATPVVEAAPAVDAHDDHEGHDHDAEEAGHTDCAAEVAKPDEHAGHDHAAHGHEDGQTRVSAPPVEQTLLSAHSAFEIKTAASGLVERMVSFPAEIQINRDRAAAVSPKYAGTVRELYAEIGDTVKAGEVLATIESRETLASYPVKAPLAGIVVSRGKSVGELAGEETMLFEIVDLSSVWVEVHIFPQYLHAVGKGQLVRLIASDGHTAKTVINYVSPLIDPQTRTLKARCVLSGGGDDFSPGAFVQAQTAVASVQARVRVEKDAVQTMNGETIVFIEDEHGIEPRDVQVGLSDKEFTEIKSGLEPGEKYVAQGAFNLKAELVTSGLDPHAGHGH